TPDLRVLGFTFAVCILTGLLFGLVPALRSLHVELNATLKSAAPGAVGSKHRVHWGKALVSAQVALSLLVLFAAGLLLRSLGNLKNLQLGFQRERLLIVRVDPPSAGYKSLPKVTAPDVTLRDRLSHLPGVSGVTSSELGLFYGSESATAIMTPGYVKKSEQENISFFDYVSPNYSQLLGIPRLLGRDIGPQDTGASPRVAVVNESFVK